MKNLVVEREAKEIKNIKEGREEIKERRNNNIKDNNLTRSSIELQTKAAIGYSCSFEF